MTFATTYFLSWIFWGNVIPQCDHSLNQEACVACSHDLWKHFFSPPPHHHTQNLWTFTDYAFVLELILYSSLALCLLYELNKYLLIKEEKKSLVDIRRQIIIEIRETASYITYFLWGNTWNLQWFHAVPEIIQVDAHWQAHSCAVELPRGWKINAWIQPWENGMILRGRRKWQVRRGTNTPG